MTPILRLAAAEVQGRRSLLADSAANRALSASADGEFAPNRPRMSISCTTSVPVIAASTASYSRLSAALTAAAPMSCLRRQQLRVDVLHRFADLDQAHSYRVEDDVVIHALPRDVGRDRLARCFNVAQLSRSGRLTAGSLLRAPGRRHPASDCSPARCPRCSQGFVLLLRASAPARRDRHWS